MNFINENLNYFNKNKKNKKTSTSLKMQTDEHSEVKLVLLGA